MTGFVLFSMLVLIAAIVVGVFYRKKIAEFLQIKKRDNGGIPASPENNGDGANQQSDGTIFAGGALDLIQVDGDGNSFFVHSLSDKQLSKGFTISHPGARTNGVKLHGEQDMNGNYGTAPIGSPTYLAMTVPTDSVFIQRRGDDIIGVCTREDASVYIKYADEDAQRVSFKQDFVIIDGAWLAIGKQWLQFRDSRPAFPGMKQASGGDTKAAPEGRAPGRISPRANARGKTREAEPPTPPIPAKEDNPKMIFSDGSIERG